MNAKPEEKVKGHQWQPTKPSINQ